jgi:hypothetical protein
MTKALGASSTTEDVLPGSTCSEELVGEDF